MVSYSNDSRSQETSVVLPRKSPGKARANERDFPHIIEIEMPANGLNVRMSREIATFHRAREIEFRFGRTRVQNDQHYCRWCFTDPLIAGVFLERFGGARVT